MEQDGKTKILVVDDRPDKLLVLQAILEDLEETILTANSGAEALKLVLEHEFAVILLDVNMPGLDGLETAALIRNRKKSAHTPIIFITAYADGLHATRGYSLGAVDYIQSPVVPAILRTKVSVFVELFRLAERAKQQAEERILLARAQAARAAAEEASRRSQFLAEAGALLSQSLDVSGRMGTLLRLAVPSVSELGGVMLLEDTGGYRDMEFGWINGSEELRLSSLPFTELPESLLRKAIEKTLESSNHVLLNDPAGVEQGVNPYNTLDNLVRGLRSVATFPMFSRGRMLGILCLGSSTSNQWFGQAEIALANDLADRAASAIDNALLYGKLQETDRLKDEFLAMLAHELRNPLAPIQNANKVLQLANPDGDRSEWATSIIERQVERMARLLDDLLDVSRITRGKIDLRRVPVQVSAIVAGAVETSRPLVDSRKHRLEVSLPAEPLQIYADQARIEQVISNLLNNAAKFTEECGVISVKVEREQDEMVCRVCDSGIGIPAEMLTRVFDLFTQVARAQSIQGSLGIGLTVVRRLVELHGGTVYAASKGIGYGAEFVVRLPLLLEEHDASATPQAAAGDRKCAGMRVMVVDDDADVSETTAALLRIEGCEASAFLDGASALEALEQFKPDAVVLDISMPLMDGYEVARRIRATPNGNRLMLIAASGHGRNEDLVRAHKSGFDCHLVKPVDPRLLISKLTRSLNF